MAQGDSPRNSMLLSSIDVDMIGLDALNYGASFCLTNSERSKDPWTPRSRPPRCRQQEKMREIQARRVTDKARKYDCDICMF